MIFYQVIFTQCSWIGLTSIDPFICVSIGLLIFGLSLQIVKAIHTCLLTPLLYIQIKDISELHLNSFIDMAQSRSSETFNNSNGIYS